MSTLPDQKPGIPQSSDDALPGGALMKGASQRRYFVSYSGIRLPFRLVSELTPDEVRNRNTYFIADFSADGQLVGFDKMVYGDLSLSHRYLYHSSGALQEATIINHDEDETTTLPFADTGCPAS